MSTRQAQKVELNPPTRPPTLTGIPEGEYTAWMEILEDNEPLHPFCIPLSAQRNPAGVQ